MQMKYGYKVQSTKYGVRSTKYGVQSTRYEVRGTGYGVRGTEYLVRGTGCGADRSGLVVVLWMSSAAKEKLPGYGGYSEVVGYRN